MPDAALDRWRFREALRLSGPCQIVMRAVSCLPDTPLHPAVTPKDAELREWCRTHYRWSCKP